MSDDDDPRYKDPDAFRRWVDSLPRGDAKLLGEMLLRTYIAGWSAAVNLGRRHCGSCEWRKRKRRRGSDK